MNCLACRKLIEGKNVLLSCTNCKGPYHYKCLCMTTEYYTKNTGNLATSWICPICDKVTRRRNHPDTPARNKFEYSLAEQRMNATDMSCDDTMDTSNQSQDEPAFSYLVSADQHTPVNYITILKQISSEINSLRKENKLQIEAFKAEVLSSIENQYKLYDDKINTLTATVYKCTNELTAMGQTLSDMQRSCSFISQQYDEVKKNLDTTQADIKAVKSEVSTLKLNNKALEDMACKLNNLEQISRSTNIEVFGIPEQKSENIQSTIIRLAEKLDVKLMADDIVFAVRVQTKTDNKGVPKPIVVKLSSTIRRDEIISAVRKRKGFTSEELGGKQGKQPSPIYVNEHLTPANKALFKSARTACKESGFRFAWVRNGRIYVRRGDTAPAILIRSEMDLRKITRV